MAAHSLSFALSLGLLVLLSASPASGQVPTELAGYDDPGFLYEPRAPLDLGLDPPPPGDPGPFRLELMGGSMAPIDVGLTARLIVLDRLVLSLGMGAGAYGQLAQVLGTAVAGEEAGTVSRHLVSGLFALHLSAGLRPIEGEGLEILGGYSLLYRDARLDASSLLSALGAQSEEGTRLDVELMLHAVHVELAWTFVVLEHFLVRPAIGWLHVVRADSSLDVVPPAGSSAVDVQGAMDDAESTLEEALSTYGMTPTLSLSIGYRF